MTAPSEQVERVVRRIVDTAHPLRIILFGSAARGDMRPDSDLDVLVVMPEGTHRRHTAQDIYQNLFGIPISVDVVAATPDDLAQRGDRVGWSTGQPCVKVEKSMPCEDFEIDPDHG
jgi:predicted nucleotidyltransferase